MTPAPARPDDSRDELAIDVFVSYAHSDDEVPEGAERGWVTTLVAELQKVLRRKLGGAGASVWMDHQLASNQAVTAELLSRLRASRTLLLVLSPGYLKSQWCRRELAGFVALAMQRGDDSCIFPIEIEPVDRDTWPSDLQSLTPVAFWRQEFEDAAPRLLGSPRPKPDEDSPYWRLVNELAHQMAKRLREAAPAIAPAARRAVVVAEATDDLEEARQRVLSSLDQRGDVVVLPRTDYPRSSAVDFVAALRHDLQSADLFVQLLGPHAGRRAPGSDRSFVALQADESRARAAAAGLRLLQWRASDLDLAQVTDPALRALLGDPHILPSSLEEFRLAVLAAVDSMQHPAPAALPVMAGVPRDAAPQDGGADGLALYLQAAPEDREVADEIADTLAGAGASVQLSPDPAPGKTFLESLMAQEEALRLCDGVLLVYGRTPVTAISAAFQYALRVFGVRRPGVWSAVLDLPPAGKPRVPVRSPNLVTIACQQRFEARVLEGFFARLRADLHA